MDELLERLARPVRREGPGQEGLPRPHLLTARLCGRRRAMGFLRSRSATSKSNMANDGRPMRVAAIGDLHVREDDVAPYREMFAEISNHADVLRAVRRPDEFRQDEGSRDPRRGHQILCDPRARRARQSRLRMRPAREGVRNPARRRDEGAGRAGGRDRGRRLRGRQGLPRRVRPRRAGAVRRADRQGVRRRGR